ncbi:TonB family protein [Pseudohalioglobus sediminis]|uniref:Protein TonB n=1 Tax=Pseudohalioglobus sediminis TaxID=2606449 RepID=A0A5B0X1Z6_9GAMM|nr:TonB family protein [Pseudohalioglobus sediminis]KAA1193293.1 TonB family protein [Pseudohalioglobus sediminis]
MMRLPPPRVVPAFLGALCITVAVFLFMQGLIQRGQGEQVELVVYEQVEILRPKPEQPEPEEREAKPDEAPEEPQLDTLQVAPPSPQPSQALSMPTLDLATGEISIQSVGDSFKAPVGVGGVNIAGGGQDAQGFVEVVPYNTRKPNVPEVAWQNKISGWVLVAFSVTPQGTTRNVRVLDARPRGVFEEKVIAAVEDWRYSVNFTGRTVADVVLTQRVNVSWQDYPKNLPNVD